MATFLEKARLLKGLLTREVAYAGPFYATVSVTRRCNLRCLGCPYHSPVVNTVPSEDKGALDLSYRLFQNLLDELKRMGTRSLTLTGEGEPMLHPRLFDMVSSAKETGFQVTLFTNGTLLDEMKIQDLMTSGLDVLRVSLWACSPEEYAHNYPGTRPETFWRVVDGLKRLTSRKAKQKSQHPWVKLHQPLNRHNFQGIESLVDLVQATGCDAVSFSPLKFPRKSLADSALSAGDESRLCLSLAQQRRRLESLSISHNIDETLLRYRIGEAVWKTLPCYIAWLHAYIRVDGTVVPCCPCNLAMGHVGERGFPEIWNSGGFRAFRRQAFTQEGLTALGRHCDCSFCCHLADNLRVHRLFRWVSPFLRASKG